MILGEMVNNWIVVPHFNILTFKIDKLGMDTPEILNYQDII
jgi:hypothetical protein